MSKEVITISLDKKIAKKLRELARKKYGNRKGAIKMVVEEAINKLVITESNFLKKLRKGVELGPPPSRSEVHERNRH